METIKIRRFSTAAFEAEGGMAHSQVFPWRTASSAPFDAMWFRLAPGQTSRRHNHYETEALFIWSGRGTVSAGAESHEITAGDVIYLPALQEHTIVNAQSGDDLTMLSLYWGDAVALAEAQRERSNRLHPRPRRVLVTATPPTPNGDLHLGHLSGPYLAADIHRRYLRLRGVPVSYLSGADSNQTYVPVKGHRLGWDAERTASHFGDTMERTLESGLMAPDIFVRPATSAFHRETVREFFLGLRSKGHLVEREAPSLHCDVCNRYLYEAYVAGVCPHCGVETGGNACEDCGRPNDCVDLGSPRCTICGSAPRVVTTRRLYFPMARFEAALRSYVARTKMSAHLGVLCDQMLDAGLPEICVTHISSWGLPVPLPGYEDQRLYSWFEMAAGYLAATRELASRGGPHHDLSNVWSDPESEIVQFFGFDNGYFHALLFPALFLAYDTEINLPRAFVVNEFYLLDGSKFSTSRNHAVWGREFLAEHPADHMRFFLSMTSPEVERTNFRLEAFRSAVTSELGRWRRWLEELASRVRTGFDMRAPEPGPLGPVEEALYGRVCALVAEAAAAYEARSFSPQRATHALCELVRSAQRFGADASHWLRAPTRRDEARTAVSLELAAARALAIAAGPIMPEFSARLWRLLGYPPGEHPVAWEDAPSFVPVGQPIGALGEALAV